MSGDLVPYLALVTSEHASKPNFVGWLSVQLQGLVDGLALYAQFTSSYDLDTAIGSQLDVVGQWVGQSRFVATPLSVYFTFDAVGLGYDQGIWHQPFDPDSGLVSLPDEQYRLLLKGVIVANQWDGSIPGAYTAWNTIFTPSTSTLNLADGSELTLADGSSIDLELYTYRIFIQDYDDMTMVIGIFGKIPDALTLALLTGGYIKVKPDGVRILGYATPSVQDQPLFGFDVPNELSAALAGFDLGNWATITAPT